MKGLIGITGGIASGKSTAVGYLKEKGYLVVDADQVVHDLQQKGGKLYKALVTFFGEGILLENGELDRPKLSALIFSDESKRQVSSQLQDEIIRQELAKLRDDLLKEHDLVFMDIPLLFELGYDSWCDAIWLVYVSKAIQVERLMLRGRYSQQEALQRISSQMPLDDKRSLATHVIDNEGSLEATFKQVDQLLAE